MNQRHLARSRQARLRCLQDRSPAHDPNESARRRDRHRTDPSQHLVLIDRRGIGNDCSFRLMRLTYSPALARRAIYCHPGRPPELFALADHRAACMGAPVRPFGTTSARLRRPDGTLAIDTQRRVDLRNRIEAYERVPTLLQDRDDELRQLESSVRARIDGSSSHRASGRFPPTGLDPCQVFRRSPGPGRP